MSSDNNRVPPLLRKLLNWDVKVTKAIVDHAYANYPKLSDQSSRSLMKGLEFSCHGIPWIAVSLIAIYMITSSREIQVNLLLGIVYDLIVVAVLKAITRRQRPSTERVPLSFGVDKLSFPSGHATRSVLLACFFTSVTNSTIVFLVVSAWAVAICVSRVLMRRHHLLDVLSGVAIGFLEWGFVATVWAGDDTVKWIASFIAGAEDEFDGS